MKQVNTQFKCGRIESHEVEFSQGLPDPSDIWIPDALSLSPLIFIFSFRLFCCPGCIYIYTDWAAAMGMRCRRGNRRLRISRSLDLGGSRGPRGCQLKVVEPLDRLCLFFLCENTMLWWNKSRYFYFCCGQWEKLLELYDHLTQNLELFTHAFLSSSSSGLPRYFFPFRNIRPEVWNLEYHGAGTSLKV